MTAFVIVKQSDSIHVITDGLVIGGLGIVSKAFTVPHLNAVVVSRGVQTVAPFFVSETWLCRDLDELRERCGDIARHCLEVNRDMMTGGPDHGPHFEIFVSGWSPTKGPVSFYTFGAKGTSSYEPFKVYDVDGSLMARPNNANIQAEITKKVLQGYTVDKLRPDLAGPRIIEIQRKHAQLQCPDTIGGHALLTSIYKDHIDQRIVREWPEHIVEDDDETSVA
ncbi:hypothetical protein [Afipia felis]|uniref:Uncharacterized protein n=2 Tax=Afipia felis TaxID=1035 RepID=A0A380W7U3_AFIFE|nr:hypothetical protein [Afipia felis]EKS28238.1 hypothetical protein HMPREF9697_00766 [Afipia felis ATCC 53690]SUU76948.1 Uncharacterised protein [Afipia felis]SUU85014.1 Uncharacterised protein [Afipia felis]